MRVTIIGGGPGGLYAAILLRRADPANEVTVLERNAPDDTFGFGVVFSAATLAELEDADAPSYEALLAACARWDPVEILYRDERIRAHGNRFAAVSRHRLLDLLQRRAADLGVDLRFRTEVGDVTEHLGSDLVVGADGVRSLVRETFAETFAPRLTVEGSTYIWLGTTKPYDAFTFIFRETEYGLFQVHIYPYSSDMSTFIVECSRDVWRKAGLDAVDSAALAPGESDEHSIAFLEELFADHLGGHRLVANNSKWLDWVTVRTGTWRHGNVVLLGDSAHTAHFSIGSGTKLALEDAIALADALARHDRLDTALAGYEAARRPAVERVQEAAAESLDWFARYARYWGFDPPQFAYSLLSRSERVDHENLRRRDPVLVLALDRWIAEEAAGRGHGAPLVVPPPPALTPFTVGPREVVNRAVLLVRGDGEASDGIPSSDLADRFVAAAGGGAGLVLAEQVAVSAHGRTTPVDAGLWGEVHERAWAAAVERARSATDAGPAGGPLLGVQLHHAGPRGATQPRARGTDLPLRAGGWQLLAASAVPYTAASAVPAPLDARTRGEVVEDFAAAAARAARAGFDLLELDVSRGHLVATFLSPLTNRRDDDLGGDLDGRLTFPLEVLDAVRSAWPADRPLSVCFSASDLEPGGLPEEEALEVARRFADRGADLLHVVAGQTTTRSRPAYGTAYHAPWSDLVRNGAGVATLTDGGIPTLAEANHVVAGGRADLCAIGRPLPVEPPWLAAHRA